MHPSWRTEGDPPNGAWVWASDGTRVLRYRHPGGPLLFGHAWIPAFDPMLFGGLIAFCAVVLLGVLSLMVYDLISIGSTPVELTSTERAASGLLVQKTFPVTMMLRIRTKAQIEERSKTAHALTLFTSPCEIWIPEGYDIAFSVRSKNAVWVSKGEGDVLAHEILHCLRGKWHD